MEIETVFNFYVIAARTKFYDNGDFPFPRKQIGSTFEGRLHLEKLSNSTFQLVLHEGHVIMAGNSDGEWRGIFSALLGHAKPAENPNICFQFTMNDILSKSKRFSYWAILDGLSSDNYVECYDMETYTGCWFRIYDKTEAEKLAKVLEIAEKIIYDEDGNIHKSEKY